MLGGYCPLILLVTILFQSSCWRVSTKQKYHLLEEESRLSPGLFSKSVHQRYGLNQASIRLPNKSRGKYWSYPKIIDKSESKFQGPIESCVLNTPLNLNHAGGLYLERHPTSLQA